MAGNINSAKAIVICSDAGGGKKFYRWGNDEGECDGSKTGERWMRTAMVIIIAQKFYFVKGQIVQVKWVVPPTAG